MIERLFIKDCLSFEKINLNLEPGLIVFTGASGVGKTVLMKSILALMGQEDAEAKSSELTIKFPFELDNYDPEDSISVIQQTKKEKTRFFLNDLTISKKKLSDITTKYIDFMNVRDFSIFETKNMIKLIDSITAMKNPEHTKVLDTFREKFKEKQLLTASLNELIENREKTEEIKSFLEFEISKIKEVDPLDDGEIEELLKVKRQISSKNKIEELIQDTGVFFEKQKNVTKLLELIGEDPAELTGAIDNAYALIEQARDNFEELQHMDIDETMQRLDDLNGLVKKYGSIGEALKRLQEKEEELLKYVNIDASEAEIMNLLDDTNKKLEAIEDKLHKNRLEYLGEFNELFGQYAEMLLLNNVSVRIEKTEDSQPFGSCEVMTESNSVNYTKLSAGEINRLRLATLAVKAKFSMEKSSGVLILDEIDSNLSGKESESVGRLLHILSKNYQILSISHQPQLTSFANQHFLVKKEGNQSTIVELTKKEDRLEEIARMISGNEVTLKAIEFADELIQGSNSYCLTN